MSTELAYKVKGYRFALDSAKFRYHPEPQEDELLSSWLVRTAFEHNADPATFINLYFPKYRNNFWNRDVDIWVPEEFLDELSVKSGLSREALDRMTLRSYEGYMCETIHRKTRNNFIQPLVSRGRVKRAPGLRYCPICLAEDIVPYYRKKWRLSFSTACVKHGCFLRDRCPNCAKPLTTYRRFRDNVSPHCYECGTQFAENANKAVEAIPRESYGLRAIRKLYEILDSGGLVADGRYIYSIAFFVGFHQLAKIAYFGRRNIGLYEHEVISRSDDHTCVDQGKHSLERMTMSQQYQLYSGILYLFENYPQRLIAFAKRNSLGRAIMVKELDVIPYWFECAIAPLLSWNKDVTAL